MDNASDMSRVALNGLHALDAVDMAKIVHAYRGGDALTMGRLVRNAIDNAMDLEVEHRLGMEDYL
jgi:hypothetical protein